MDVAHPGEDQLLSLALGELPAARAAELEAHVRQCDECARELAWARRERGLFARRAAPQVDALWAAVAARTSAPAPDAAEHREGAPRAIASARALEPQEDEAAAPLVELSSGTRVSVAASPERAAAAPVARSSRRAARRPHRARPVALGLAGAAVAAALAFGLFARKLPRSVARAPAPASDGVASAARDPASPAAPAAEAPDEGDSVDPRALAALDKAEGDYRHAAAILEEEYEAARPHLDPRVARRWDASLRQARTQLGGASASAARDPDAKLRVLDGYAGYLRSLHEVIEHSEEAKP